MVAIVVTEGGRRLRGEAGRSGALVGEAEVGEDVGDVGVVVEVFDLDVAGFGVVFWGGRGIGAEAVGVEEVVALAVVVTATCEAWDSADFNFGEAVGET